MNVPEKLAGQGLERAEYVICLPPDWNLNSPDEKDYWPHKTSQGNRKTSH